MAAEPRVGRPRTRDKEEPRQYVGFPVPVSLKKELEAAARDNGRSLSAECAARLQQSFEDAPLPSEIGAFAELLGRVMLETGTAISGANRWSGRGFIQWEKDPYAFDQAAKAALYVLRLSRPSGPRVPHGLFATAAYQQKKLAHRMGKQIADGILRAIRRREDDGTWATWTGRIRRRLATIGARLDEAPEPEEWFGPPTTESGPDVPPIPKPGAS